MTPIAFLARRPHFAEHLAPIWLALPEEARGIFVAWDDATRCAAERMGVTVSMRQKRSDQRYTLERMDGQPVVVAGSHDMLKAYGVGARIALATHGIGQSYSGRGRRDKAWTHLGSPGGLTRDMVGMFLHPGADPARRDRERYPGARVEVIGSPMLDRLHRKARDGRAPVVAVTTHWDWDLCPETHSALVCPHYGGWYGILDAILELSKTYHVIGHGHPRLFSHPAGDLISATWEGMGIEVVRDFDEVCRRADLLVGDNTSVLYEFASTGRPVVMLDPPWYDRSVGHGLRFWAADHVGLHVTDPRTLTDTVTESLVDGRWHDREEALDMVFTHRDHAAERAAVALLDWARERRMAA